MQQDRYDVIVVGAGPGGTTAARFCARAGLKTLLIEKERFPRYKPCGGCLSLKTVALLGFDLTPVLENTIRGAKFTYRLRDPIFLHRDQPIAWLVMRDRFDQFLLEKTLAEGAVFREGETVIRVGEKGNGWELELARGERVLCEYLIGADGPKSIVGRSIVLPPGIKETSGIAVQCEIPLELALRFPKKEYPLVHLDFGGVPNGYGWVFPKKEGLSVGIGGMLEEGEKFNPRHCFNTFIQGLNYIDGKDVKKAVGHPLPSFYGEGQRVSRGRCLLVGDAAHLMDPLMGEGIYYAIQSGMLASEAILQSRADGASPSDLYQSAVHAHLFENLRWALQFSRFVFRFPKLAYQTLKGYPELADLYLQVLEGSVTYQGFVTRVKARMADLLKGRFSKKIRNAMGRI